MVVGIEQCCRRGDRQCLYQARQNGRNLAVWLSTLILFRAFGVDRGCLSRLWMLIPVAFCMSMPPGLIIATLQTIAPNELRGQMVAFYLIAVNFFIFSFAPLPALFSDFVFESELALGKSISTWSSITASQVFVSVSQVLSTGHGYDQSLAKLKLKKTETRYDVFLNHLTPSTPLGYQCPGKPVSEFTIAPLGKGVGILGLVQGSR